MIRRKKSHKQAHYDIVPIFHAGMELEGLGGGGGMCSGLILLNVFFPLRSVIGLVAYVLLEGDFPPNLDAIRAEIDVEGNPNTNITLDGHDGPCREFVDACLKYKPEDRPCINALIDYQFLQILDVEAAKSQFSQLVTETLGQMDPPPE